MRNSFAGFCGVLLFLFSLTAAQADDQLIEEGQWYVTPMGSYVIDDQERLADPGLGGHLGVGKRIHPRWLLEFNLTGDHLDGWARYGQWGLGVDLIAAPDNGRKITPYGLIGVGYLDTRAAVPAGAVQIADTENFMASFGGGLLIPIGAGNNLLRAEVRLRNDFADDSLSDYLFSLGVIVPFGSGDPAPIAPDADGDGVADAVDLCPGTPRGAAVDEYGCEFDTDGDGVIDRKDRCPNTRKGATVDAAGCEVTADSDGDGVPDDRDVCPGTPRGTPVGANGCERDSDGDGVVDSKDACPNTKKGVRVDFRGCEIRAEIALPGVNFEFDSARLTPGSRTELNGAVTTLNRYPEIKAECSGHTDSLGPDDYNQRLSQKRAEAVCEFLLTQGIAPTRLTARGYGESAPIADNDTPEGQARNRRVALRIVE